MNSIKTDFDLIPEAITNSDCSQWARVAYDRLHKALNDSTVPFGRDTAATFSIDRKYKKVKNLILAYVWHVHDANATVTYALEYKDALRIASQCWGRAKGNSASWKRGRYSTSKPSRKLRILLEPFKISEGKWWEKETGTPYKRRFGLRA